MYVCMYVCSGLPEIKMFGSIKLSSVQCWPNDAKTAEEIQNHQPTAFRLVSFVANNKIDMFVECVKC